MTASPPLPAPLTIRAADVGAIHPDRRGPPVIGDRHMLVVRQERRIRPEQTPRIGRMLDRGEEVDEAAGTDGQPHLGIGHAEQEGLKRGLVRRSRLQALDQGAAESPPHRRLERHQWPERRRGQHRRGGIDLVGQLIRDGREIQDAVAYGNPDAELGSTFRPEHAEGQVLQREIGPGIMGGGNPAAAFGSMGLIDGAVGHDALGVLRKRPAVSHRMAPGAVTAGGDKGWGLRAAAGGPSHHQAAHQLIL